MSNPAVMLVRRLLHLIAHATGWNRCQPIRGGYICVGCGETVTWDLPPGDPATYCAGIITSITRDEMTVTVQSEPDNYITDNGPGITHCLECGEEIPDDDTGQAPYCGRCWQMLQEEGFFDGGDT